MSTKRSSATRASATAVSHSSDQQQQPPPRKKARVATSVAIPTDPHSPSVVGVAPSTAEKQARKPSHRHHLNPLAKKYGHHLRTSNSTAPDGRDSQTAASHGAAEETSARLRKSIRDAERTLRRPNLSATQQTELERRIKALRIKLDAKLGRDKEEALRTKYKYIRFVEEKKCVRRVLQFQTQIKQASSSTSSSDADADAELRSELARWEGNLAYVRHFPVDIKYISLFPVENDGKETVDAARITAARREAIWNAIRDRSESGNVGTLREKDIFGSTTTEDDDDEEEDKDVRKHDAYTVKKEADDFFLMGADDDDEEGAGNLEEEPKVEAPEVKVEVGFYDSGSASDAATATTEVKESPTAAAASWRYEAEDELEPRVTLSSLLRDREQGHAVSFRSHPRVAPLLQASCTEPALHRFSTDGLDKIFAGKFLNPTTVLVGTKCGSLILLNTTNDSQHRIPLMGPPAAVRAMALNSRKTFIAIAVGLRIEVFALPGLDPIGILAGHRDVVFSVVFTDDTTVTSGSRDGTVRVWSISSLSTDTDARTAAEKTPPSLASAMSVIADGHRVRALTSSPRDDTLALLSTGGYLRIYDLQTSRPLVTLPLRYTSETTCLASLSNTTTTATSLHAVGSARHISVLDPRTPSSVVHTFPSLDSGWGVRSLLFESPGTVAVGGGLGHVCFYDLRRLAYSAGATVGSVGTGWVERDRFCVDAFGGRVGHAVYALEREENEGRLFVAGGPLQVGLKGSMAGVW
ncbi:hypothetical protein HKX48_006789 [Thoreauomyces humboldtii]|nr:hypothetical protein HKX48_006789 [Thoreauomyces humboldtii]